MKHLFPVFFTPSATDILKRNLIDYERQLVAQEEAAALHTKMAEYYRESIARVRSQVAAHA